MPPKQNKPVRRPVKRPDPGPVRGTGPYPPQVQAPGQAQSGAYVPPVQGQSGMYPPVQATGKAQGGPYVPPVRDVSPRTKRDYGSPSRPRYGPDKAPARPKRGIRWPQLIVILLLLAAVVAAGLFAWDRWFRYDDTRDFQGDWVSAGTAAAVYVDGKTIELTPEIHYAYQLDTWQKTITYTFGDLKGSGIYRFSADRTKLVIIEGGASDWIQDAKVALGLAQPEEGTDAEKTTVLAKAGHSASTGPDAGSLSLLGPGAAQDAQDVQDVPDTEAPPDGQGADAAAATDGASGPEGDDAP